MPNVVGFGAEKPVNLTYSYIRPDLPNDLRVVSVAYDVGGRSGAFVNTVTPRQQTLALPVDIEAIFAAVERSGGSNLRAEWGRDWQAGGSTVTFAGPLQVRISYSRGGPPLATFTYDVATGAVTRGP